MIPQPVPTPTFRQLQSSLVESPVFKDQTHVSHEQLGKICAVKHALKSKIRERMINGEDDKRCLGEIYQQVKKVLSVVSDSPLHQELAEIRHLTRMYAKLGRPRLNKTNKDAQIMLNLKPANKVTKINNINEIFALGNIPFAAEDPILESHFKAIDQISNEEIVSKATHTLVRGPSRNRIDRVLPYMDNQVGGREINRKIEDYVNGSLINFGKMSFIVAQAPMKIKKNDRIKNDTVPYFLNMLKLGCNTIVTLCMPQEGSEEACAQWWDPKELADYKGKKCPEIWGPHFTFEYLSETEIPVEGNISTQKIVERQFRFKNNDHSRIVTQFHITDWPSKKGCNQQVLKTLIEHLLQQPIKGPMIVHGSEGAGRPGTFILAYKNYKEVTRKLKEGKPANEINVNLFYDTLDLRTQRENMVETAEQICSVKKLLMSIISSDSASKK